MCNNLTLVRLKVTIDGSVEMVVGEADTDIIQLTSSDFILQISFTAEL